MSINPERILKALKKPENIEKILDILAELGILESDEEYVILSDTARKNLIRADLTSKRLVNSCLKLIENTANSSDIYLSDEVKIMCAIVLEHIAEDEIEEIANLQ